MARTPQVSRYRIRNWREYNRALTNRGRLTVWFDEQAIVAWRNTAPAAGPGAPRVYADLAIEGFVASFHLRGVPLCCSPEREVEEKRHDELQGEPI